MQLQNSFQNVLIIPPVTPHSAILGFTDDKVNYYLINLILLIFKYYVYKTRKSRSLDLKVLKRSIHKIKNIEKQVSFNKPEMRKKFKQKWKPLLENTAHILKYLVMQTLGGLMLAYFFRSICCYFLY